MTKVLKKLPFIIISIITFVTVSLIDVVLLLVALLNRGVRSIAVWLLRTFEPDGELESMDELCKDFVNYVVNCSYKHYIDLMYPVEEDLEEYFEDLNV